MKITREQYEKAVSQLPKLMKAKRTAEIWEAAMDSLGEKTEGLEVVALEFDDRGRVTASCRPLEPEKEETSAEHEASGSAA